MSIVTRNFTIPAGGEIKIARQADFVRCLDATATITVQFDNGDTADLATGLSYSPEGGFRELTVLNGTANPVTVKLNLGKGQMADNRASVNTSQIMPTREAQPDTIKSSSVQLAAFGSAITPLVAQNSLRKEVVFTNADAASAVWIIDGSTPATTRNGIKLTPGQSATLTASAAVFAISDDTGTPYVSILETLWSA